MRRPEIGKALWHVYCRGARRLGLYYESADYEEFLRLLGYAMDTTGCTAHAYALMPNHYHILMSGDSRDISDCMRRVNQMYSRRHNEHHRSVGHTFDGPYQAHVQRGPYLSLCRAAYILANPIVAGLSAKSGDYPWTSSGAYTDGRPDALPVDADSVLRLLDPEPARARTLFGEYLRREITRPALHRECPHLEVMIQQFVWILEHARRTAGPLDPLDLAVGWSRALGIPPRAMAQALGLEDSTEVRQRLAAVGRRIKRESRLFNKINGGFC